MDREQIYDALREADKAGDAEAVQKLTDYLNTLPDVTSEAAPAKVEEPFSLDPTLSTVGGGVAGWVGKRALPKIYEQAGEAFGIKAPNFLDTPSGVTIPDKYLAQGQNGVRNWSEATYNRPYQGGKSYAEEAKLQEKFFKPRENLKSSSRIPQTGGLSISNQPVDTQATLPQMRAARMQKAGKLAALPGNVAQDLSMKGIPTGMLGGYNASEAVNRRQEDPLGAVLSGVGTLGTAASYSKNPVVKGLGLGVGAAAPAINYLRDKAKKEEQEKRQKSIVEKAMGGVVGYSKGSAVKGGLEAIKKAFAPKPTKIVRASEALGPHEGKFLNLTQSDRMRSTGGDLGGPGFSKFQLERPEYEGAAWGVGNKPTASGIININKRYPEGKAIWAPMIGAEGQHRSNLHVYDALTDEFNRQVSMGKLTPELRAKMNSRLSEFPKYAPLKLQDIDVGNPETIKSLGDTFDRRAAIAEVLGGEGIGGRKGMIFDYPGIMQEMTDPMTIRSPTHSVGTRLFTLNNEIEHRPDLHSAFPFILKGEDMGVAFNPVPKELAFPDWLNLVREFKGKEPGYMEFTRGVTGKGKPHQFISEEYLRALEEAGHKEGGHIAGYAAGNVVKKGVQAGLKALEPKETVKAYKLFRTDPKTPDALFPLFVNANKPVPIGEWLPAEAGELTNAGKVKSKIGDLAYRPGWHAGDMPIATHIGGKSSPELTAPDFRPSNQVWAEIEMPADKDWQTIALERAQRNKKGEVIPRTAHITDTIPEGGHYRYKTNPNMTGDWLIGGSMKVNRVLSPEEVMAINESFGVADLPRFEPLKKKADGGLICLKEGGSTAAWQRKEGKNPEGGLNAAGRASYNRETGGHLKPPVSAEQAKKSPKSAARRKSFCARMSGMEGPMKDEKGRPTRKALALRKWDC